MDDEMAGVRADLRAEQDDLRERLRDVRDERWDTPTPAVGWNVRDQITHLAYGEELAALALVDPERFITQLTETMSDLEGELARVHERGRSLTADALLDWWSDAGQATLAALEGRDARDRVTWAGGPMSAASFAKARIMETWAHGQDIDDALGLGRPATARLRHIAELGVKTRGFAYAIRGLQRPESDVRVELVSPGGELWTWGPADAEERVTGPAVDFCLVVTRRRNPADTSLIADGAAALQWLEIAQAYLGPPEPHRPAGAFGPAGAASS